MLELIALCLYHPLIIAGSIEKLEEAEKALGITPDSTLAAYMTAMQKAGRQNMITDLVLKTLDLEICAETVVVGVAA